MTSDILRRLAEPFDPSIVSFRVGPTTKDKTKGMALAYVDARDVMNRLDAVIGPASWQNDYPWSDGKRVVCRIGIKLDDEWVWKADGAGDTDTEGEKGALSDAFKRSAVHWGIGRYLYDVDAPWVVIEQKGGSYVIAPAELVKLRSRLPRPAVPNVKGEPAREAPPPGYGNINKAALPASPEEPPEVAQARKHIRSLIDKWDTIIKTAPAKHALELSLDDGKYEITEIEEAGENGKQAAMLLRRKAAAKLAQFDNPEPALIR